MKKKIFTLLTLLLTVCSGAWASTVDDLVAISSDWTFIADDITSNGTVKPTANTLYCDGKIFFPSANTVATNKGNSTIGGVSHFNSLRIKNTQDQMVFKVAGACIVKFYTQSHASRGLQAGSEAGGTQYGSQDISTSTWELELENAATVYISSFGGDFYIAGFEVTFIKRPEITTQPQSANYVTGYAATALHVAATSSGGDLSYQWYRCDDANKSNPSEISGATAASYAPSTTYAGTFYYFCVVRDDNGYTASNVATITVSAAAAPTISVSGAPVGDIATGTEVTLTATVTGNPAPTVKWFSNTNASTTGGTFTGETGETFSPSTATPGTYYYFAQAVNTEGNALSAVQTIVVKDQVATPTFDPNGSYFEDSKQVTISCTTEDATIQYSTDNGATWTAYTGVLIFTETTTLQAKATKDDYIDSEIASATFTKITLAAQTSISGATTWDWTKYGTKEIGTSDTDFYRSDVLVANVSQYGFAAPAADFGPADALVLNGDFIVRDGKYCQVTHAKFTTTVPGTINVEFSNTGGNRPYRYLYVNGVQTEFKSNVSNSNTTATDIPVSAGDVDIYGVLDPESEDSGAGSVNFLRIYNITFTPLPDGDVVSVTDAAYATHVLADDIDFTKSEGVTAYKAKVVGDNIQLIEVEQAPAGTPLVIAATKDVYTLTKAETTPAAVADNDLKAATTTIKQSDATPGNTIYVLNVKNDVVGFYKLSATGSLQAGKAYIEAPSSTSAREMFGFSFYEDATGIKAVENEKMNVENGEFFNLSGQRVAQPTKGLYIVNGKKVIK